MVDLIELQFELASHILRVAVNFKRKVSAKIIKGEVVARMNYLDAMWSTFEMRHEEIKLLATKNKQLLVLPYFTNHVLQMVEEAFFEEMGELQEILKQFNAGIASPDESTSTEPYADDSSESRQLSGLPMGHLPSFNGQSSKWESFRDRFKSLVIDEPSLSNLQRLYCLKGCLEGEAALVIESVAASAENFEVAWRKLHEHYKNCWQNVLIGRTDLRESPTELTLLHRTCDVVDALELLGCSIATVPDILVMDTAVKLDPESIREWNWIQINSMGPVSFRDLKNYIQKHINAVHAMEQQMEDRA